MNEGKQFEKDFRDSIPDDVYSLRLVDPAIGFDVEHSVQRFTPRNPYDLILYKKPTMYCLELKSTKGTAISFQGSSPMIKEHQIKKLTEAAGKGCQAGFVLNFRGSQRTYYLPIKEFHRITRVIGKSSLNEDDVRGTGLPLPVRHLKVHNRYDMDILFGLEQIQLF